MNCTQIRNSGYCPFKGKAKDCLDRGPMVKPSGHTCRNMDVYEAAIRGTTNEDLSRMTTERDTHKEKDW